MPVPFTAFTPSAVRAAWKSGANLNAGCTTSSYSGGAPSAATDLKPSICDYDTGTIKKGLTTADDTALKPSVLIAISGSTSVPPELLAIFEYGSAIVTERFT